MTSSTLHFNRAVFVKKFQQYIDKDLRIKQATDKFAQKIFSSAKTKLIQDFNDSKITQELKEGPGAENISGTLGYGNLFAFLGFWDDQQPTLELEQLLLNISMGRQVTRRGNTVYYKVNVPDRTTIEDVTRLNWGNTSWCYAIEDGEFNGDAALSHFVYKSWVGGRSKEGFQIEANYSESEFSPKPFLTEILNNFRARINGETI